MGVALQDRHPVLGVIAVPPTRPEHVARPRRRLPEGRRLGPVLRGERIASRARESSVLECLPAARRGSPEESRPTRDRGGGQEFTPVASRIPHPRRDSLQRCHRPNQTVRGSSSCGRRCRPEAGVPWPARPLRSLMHVETEAIPLFGVFPAARLRRAVPTGGRRSLASGPSGRLWSGSVKVVEAAGIEPASESLLQRRLHAYPGCGREPAPGGAFPSFGPAPHQPGESRLGTYPLCSPTAREDRRQSPPMSTPFPARQAWSGRTWLLKQPVPVQCWLLFCFHRLREVDPRHAIVASCTFVEPSAPPSSRD